MNEFIKMLLSMSACGTLLLFLILGLKQFYKNKFSRRWQYYIWVIAVLRFLLPFAPDTMNIRSLLEIFQTTAATNESPPSRNGDVSPNIGGNEPQRPPLPTLMPENDPTAFAAPKPFPIYGCVFFVWSASALALFVRKITIYRQFIRFIRSGNTQVSDIKTLNLLSCHKETMHVRTKVELYRNDSIVSPIMVGFFRPSIILPAVELDDEGLSYIFMHELRHCKQRDMFYKWLVQIVICIHWFNPFVYLLEKEINKACELSCDEAVIAMLDDYARRGYGDTLISFYKSNNFRKSSFASVTLTEGAKELKERLGAIMYYKKKTKTTRMATGMLTLCIIFGAAFDSNIAGSINTVSGNVMLSPSGMWGDLHVNSCSAEIMAHFGDSVSCSLKAETVSGQIKGSYWGKQSKLEKEFTGTVGSNPQFMISLKTISGTIQIN